MTRAFSISLVLLVVMTQLSFGASNWFPIRAEPDRTESGRELDRDVTALCQAFFLLDNHRRGMIQARDGDGSNVTHYAPVARKYGFVDVATGGTLDNTVAQNGFLELDSWIAGISAATNQGCAKFAQ